MVLFLLLTLLLILVYYVITRKYSYFKNKKVAHQTPRFLFGNYGDYILQKKSFSDVIRDLCIQFPDEKLVGAYFATEPVLIPKDPDILKLILTKDFSYFSGRELTEYNHRKPMMLNIFNSHGDDWRVLRQNMTPMFSSAKMKNMFHLIQKCSYTFESMLDKEVAMSNEIDIENLSIKFIVECIAACVFGIDANAMTDDPKINPFTKTADFLSNVIKNHFFVILLRSLWPSIYFFLSPKSIVSGQLSFFHNLLSSVLTRRNYQSSRCNDFVDLFLSWKQKKYIEGDSIKNFKTGAVHKVTLTVNNDLLIGQGIVLFSAGFESSSITLMYTLYELAKNQKIQDKVLEEVDGYLARHDNKLLYECLTEMPYLDAVIDETLRIYPIIPLITRETTHDYVFPDGVFIEKGMRIHLPVHYLHHNPKYYPMPEEFHPERFFGDERKKIIPYTYLPFGAGPRICIGVRFSKMQMMAGFITMLKKYRLELAEDVPKKLHLKTLGTTTRPCEKIKLKFIEREGWENRIFKK